MSEKDLSTTTENNASPKSTIDYWEKDWLNFAISDPIDPNDARSNGLKVLSCDYILGFPGVLDPTKEKNQIGVGPKENLTFSK